MATTPTAALIIIGNEILSGRTHDTNTKFLATELTGMGIRLIEVRVIPDIAQTIIATVNALRPLVSYVFTTGGIGPTHDDITSAAIADAFHVPLIRHPEAVRRLSEYYSHQTLTDARLKMADIPEGAQLIDNPVSSAPGYYIENVYVMAGVPNIMHAMFLSIKGTLQGSTPIQSHEFTAYISESQIATALGKIQDNYATVEIGSYPFREENRHGTKLVLRSTEPLALAKACTEVEALIKAYS